MALIACRECKKEVSDQAKTCPHCGVTCLSKPSTAWRLLKIIAIVALSIVGLAMCSAYSAITARQSKGSAPSYAEKLATGGTSCTLNDITITATRAKFVDKCKTRECIILQGVGVLQNNCSEAVGVQIKITAYDKNNSPLATRDMWPASIRNIPPGAYEFSIDQWIDYDPAAKSFALTPIAIKKY
jgi:RNA polymerase subunit RPABC4/transcription elongation factor Spt4